MSSNRRSPRAPGYDYTQPGAYFVTLLTWQRAPILGEVLDKCVHLSPIGRLVHTEWRRLALRFKFVALDEFVIMPDHVHGILWLQAPGEAQPHQPQLSMACLALTGSVAPSDCKGEARQPDANSHHTGLARPRGAPAHSLGAIVGAFKSSVTLRANLMQNASRSSVWQRNYYEHVIRTEAELNRTRLYIQQNPLKWVLNRSNNLDV
ncbi:MAG TPA: hypothetical protein PK454_06025 [Anaerolineaceae bacterium]|nr:hypothetical protein [Anaerolineaceae bacterium]